MLTKQAIQTSAQVIRITQVSAGDVYKRFDKSYDDRVYFGIVRNVHNDGENTIIEATEYCKKYSDLEVSHKVLKGDTDYILFPATPEELNLELEGARKSKVRAIEEAEEEIAKNRKLITELDGIISGETLKGLKSASYKELSQGEYNQKKEALALME